VIDISQMQSQFEQLMPPAPSKKSSRKSILALSVFALGLNAAAAAYTISPSDFALPNVSGLVAELLPHETASKPIPDAVVATLNDIQSEQQHIATALQGNGSSLQHNTALLEDNGPRCNETPLCCRTMGPRCNETSLCCRTMDPCYSKTALCCSRTQLSLIP